jgi:hypothetical protein
MKKVFHASCAHLRGLELGVGRGCSHLIHSIIAFLQFAQSVRKNRLEAHAIRLCRCTQLISAQAADLPQRVVTAFERKAVRQKLRKRQIVRPLLHFGRKTDDLFELLQVQASVLVRVCCLEHDCNLVWRQLYAKLTQRSIHGISRHQI